MDATTNEAERIKSNGKGGSGPARAHLDASRHLDMVDETTLAIQPLRIVELLIDKLYEESVRMLWDFLQSKGEVKLEPVTTRVLKRHLYLGLDAEELSDAWLRSYFRRALISLLIGEGKAEEATRWLERLREVGLTDQEHAELSELIRLSSQLSGIKDGG